MFFFAKVVKWKQSDVIKWISCMCHYFPNEQELIHKEDPFTNVSVDLTTLK